MLQGSHRIDGVRFTKFKSFLKKLLACNEKNVNFEVVAANPTQGAAAVT